MYVYVYAYTHIIITVSFPLANRGPLVVVYFLFPLAFHYQPPTPPPLTPASVLVHTDSLIQ